MVPDDFSKGVPLTIMDGLNKDRKRVLDDRVELYGRFANMVETVVWEFMESHILSLWFPVMEELGSIHMSLLDSCIRASVI